MKSVMQHSFSMIPHIEIPRSVFNRSHGYKTTFNEGDLIPFLCDEVLPGDTVNLRSTLLARLATPIVPVMDNMYLETFYFFIPNRLLWQHWINFQGEVQTPSSTITVSYINPTIQTYSGTPGQLGDYFGLPVNLNTLTITPLVNKVSSLPFRAYNLVYNEWFRDENLVDRADTFNDDTSDYIESYPIRKRGKRHDYFTSSLLWPQKGPGVMIPLGGTAPVVGNGSTLTFVDTVGGTAFSMAHNSADVLEMSHNIANENLQTANASFSSKPTMYKGLGVSTTNSGLIANLASATSATINSLRQAFQLQRLYERDARGGSRYVEILRSHFGVTNPGLSVLMRPEYLGGSSKLINVTPVQQNSSTDTTTPQGNLAAYGMVVDNSGGFHKSFAEHGIILGILNVRADLTYQRGLNRMWTRKYREDYYMPVLAHLGEQEVYSKEIYCDGTAGDDNIFGYQERYGEYRYFPSQITGKMRSRSIGGGLDVWHLSQDFTTRPTLGKTFIEENPPVDRCIAVKDEPHFILDSFIEMKCARPMPVYSVPGLIDHF